MPVTSTPADSEIPPTTPEPPRRKRERWWWLLLFLLVSLVLHLGVGWEGRSWNLLGSVPMPAATPPPGEVEVVFGPTPAQEGAAPKNVAVKGPHPAPPTPAPPPRLRRNVREAPRTKITAKPLKFPPPPSQKSTEPERPASPARAVSGGGESIVIAKTPSKSVTPVPSKKVDFRPRPPLTAATPTPFPSPPGVPDAPKAPLALLPKAGDAGSPTAPSVKAAPESPSHAPLPNATTGERAATKVTDEPLKTRPVTPPTVPLGAGNSDKSGAPVAGITSRIGLTRGIPFGVRAGLSNGLPPGEGVGPDGQPTGVRSGYVNGVFHVVLGRPTAASLGLKPARIVYVLDVSGSMAEDHKIGLAREALRTAVGELLPDDYFAFVTFSEHPHAYSETLLRASVVNIATQKSNVDLIQPGGGTDLSDALDLALGMSGATHIFVISDGEPNIGITKPEDLCAHLHDRNPGAAVRISVFALGSGEQFDGVKLLRRIAEENGGEYRYINDKEDFDK